MTLSDILLVPLTAIADAIRASKTERTLVDILSKWNQLRETTDVI